jgi:hypothetical protein
MPKNVFARAVGGEVRKLITEVKPEFINAESPIEVTLAGIVTEVNPVQFRNALLPMVVTLSPIVRCLVFVPNGAIDSE